MQLRVVFRNSPLPLANSVPAARAALAAHQQGKFWAMHDLLFANQQRLDHDSLLEYARRIGLDIAAFQRAFDSAAVTQALANDADAAARLVVKATPIMTVNGKPIVGARPVSEIVSGDRRGARALGYGLQPICEVSTMMSSIHRSVGAWLFAFPRLVPKLSESGRNRSQNPRSRCRESRCR